MLTSDPLFGWIVIKGLTDKTGAKNMPILVRILAEFKGFRGILDGL